MRNHVLFLFALFLSTAAYAQDTSEPILKDVDDMPLYPGTTTKAESDTKMLAFVYDNVKYPGVAREAKVEGMAVVSFVVERDGTLSNINVVRDPGENTGAEAYHIVRRMQEEAGAWTPGMEKGVAVRTQHHLPIKFALSK